MTGPTRRGLTGWGEPGRLRWLALLLGLALVATASGCTGDPEPQAKPSPSPTPTVSATPEPESVPMKVVVTRVHGKLPTKAHAPLEAKVGRTLRAYLDAAFLGGDYPRSTFPGAFASFTGGAARDARHDHALLTNARFGPTTDSVRAVRRAAYLSVLAPYKVAAGVTAKVDLVFLVDRADRPAERVHVTGRLLLTRDKSNGWAIFGYDLARSNTPVRSAS